MTNDAIPDELRNEMDDSERLLNLVKQLAADVTDPKVLAQVAEITEKIKDTKEIVSKPSPGVVLHDAPDSILDSRLGELCLTRMRSFPRAFAFLALIAVASAMCSRRIAMTAYNIFAALVGPVHCGKSQCIEWALQILGIAPPYLLNVRAGSAEGLVKKYLNALGDARLLALDELGHLLAKSQIQNSSFSYLLCEAFYKSKFEMVLARNQTATFHASLSVLGGIVDSLFGDFFSAASVAGLYDRFLLAAAPGGFLWDYEPFEGEAVQITPVAVRVDREVWTVEKAAWIREVPGLTPRIAELCIRCATVCAAFDGRKRLTVKDLAPALEFARYQVRLREVLKPNVGENASGKIGYKLLDYLDRLGGCYVERRKLFQDTNVYRLGAPLVKTVFDTLCANGEIEIQKVGRVTLVRRCNPEGVIDPAGNSNGDYE